MANQRETCCKLLNGDMFPVKIYGLNIQLSHFNGTTITVLYCFVKKCFYTLSEFFTRYVYYTFWFYINLLILALLPTTVMLKRLERPNRITCTTQCFMNEIQLTIVKNMAACTFYQNALWASNKNDRKKMPIKTPMVIKL